jgi:hypothetical protein
MNKTEALIELEKAKERVEKLENIIKEIDENMPKRWKPGLEQTYYRIITDNNCYPTSDFLYVATDIEQAYSSGNMFKNLTDADYAASIVSNTLKVIASAFRVDPYAGHFRLFERRWSVYKAIASHNGWKAIKYSSVLSAPVYVHTKEQAEMLADMLNSEDV